MTGVGVDVVCGDMGGGDADVMLMGTLMGTCVGGHLRGNCAEGLDHVVHCILIMARLLMMLPEQ